MPFRIPLRYRDLPVRGEDPSKEELGEYIFWLRAELEITKKALKELVVAENLANNLQSEQE